jgi:hypothetical protein
MEEVQRVPNRDLLQAGLEAMRRKGQPLTRRQVRGRAMIYETGNGETVRVRTCNDHVLIILADSTDLNAKLNVEGTDWLLVVMPEEPRTPGAVVVYLIPAKEVVAEARKTHEEWLASEPNTKGGNVTWNLWFNDAGPSVASGYAEKWSRYRLESDVSTGDTDKTVGVEAAGQSRVADVISAARLEIAQAAGVSVDAVRVSIEFAS